MDIQIGARFGKYRVLSEIGRGGMGTVYLAVDTSLDRRVALKVLSPRLLSDDLFLDQLRKEAKVVASFSHPNVVHVNAFDQVGATAFIEMEYIDGGSLSQKLRREVVTLFDVLLYARDIAQALSYCHDLGAIHRDIKPSNILIDSHGSARLVDFGIAKAVAESERGSVASSWSGLFQGTPSYAPPEAWEGAAPAPTWDLYSLGVVLYEAVTGGLPFEAATPLELVRKMAMTTFVPVRALNAGVSEPFAELIEHLLIANVAERLDDANLVIERLEQCPEWQMQTDRSAPTLAAPRRKKAKRSTFKNLTWKPVRRAFMAVVLLLLSALAGAKFWSSSGESGSERVSLREPLSRQSSLDRSVTMSAEELLAANKGGLGDRVENLEAHWGNSERISQWLVVFFGDVVTEILAVEPNRLAVYRATPGLREGEYSVEGGWAAYGDSRASVLRYGTASGTVQVQQNPRSIVGTFSLFTEQDGSSTEVILRATTPSVPMNDAQFIAQMEAARSVQALLYRELIPRSFAWASRLDALMPAFINGDLAVPVSTHALLPDFGVDSQAQSWSVPASNWSRELQGVPSASNATLRVAADPSHFFAFVETNFRAGDTKALLEINGMNRYGVPIEQSPVWSLRYDLSAGELLSSTGFNPGVLNGPQIRSYAKDGRLHMAIRIPYDALEEGAPNDTARWRMNVVLREGADDGQNRPIVRWGYPDEKKVWHGIKIRFQSEGGVF